MVNLVDLGNTTVEEGVEAAVEQEGLTLDDEPGTQSGPRPHPAKFSPMLVKKILQSHICLSWTITRMPSDQNYSAH